MGNLSIPAIDLIFYGAALFTALITFALCSAQYKSSFTACIALVFGLVLMQSSMSQALASLLPQLIDKMSLSIQLFGLTITGISILQVQLYSLNCHEQLASDHTQSMPSLIPIFCRSIQVIILVPLIGYLIVQEPKYQQQVFTIFHLPAFYLILLIGIIISAMNVKKLPAQKYLLLAWIGLLIGMLLQTLEIYNIPLFFAPQMQVIPDWCIIFPGFSLVFLTLWMLHVQIPKTNNNDNLQLALETLEERNKSLEILSLRANEFSQKIVKTLHQPLTKTLQFMQSQELPEREEVKQMLHLIHEFMLVDPDTQWELQLNNLPFDFRQTIESATLQFQKLAKEEHIGLIIEISENIPEALTGDAGLISRLLQVLLAFATERTSTGEVRCALQRSNDPRSPTVMLKIIIEDNGPELTNAELNQFWDPYAFGNNQKTTQQRFELNLAKNIVYRLNGDIFVEPKPRAGISITSSIPCKAAQGRPTQPNYPQTSNQPEKPTNSKNPKAQADNLPALQSYHKRLSILIVDDNPVDLTLIKKILNNLDHKVHAATSGESSIDTSLIEHIDLVLMDIQLPGINGFESARYIKEYAQDSNIPIIGMSSNDSAEFHALAKNYGMIELLQKPLSSEIIETSIGRLL